jgi:hypothetical protein
MATTPTLALDPILSITTYNNNGNVINQFNLLHFSLADFFPFLMQTKRMPQVKRKKGPTYQEHEDAQLCCSWIEVSEDPSVGTDQASTRFWDCISRCYHDAIPQPPRPIGSIKGRWQLISHGVSKFTGCVKHIDRLNASGATSEDRLTQALLLFAELQGKTFTFLWC